MNKVGKIACIVLIAILIVIMIISNNSSASSGTMSVKLDTDGTTGGTIKATIELKDDKAKGATYIYMVLKYDKNVFEVFEDGEDTAYEFVANEEIENAYEKIDATFNDDYEEGIIGIRILNNTEGTYVDVTSVSINLKVKKDVTAETGRIEIEDGYEIYFGGEEKNQLNSIDNQVIDVPINKSETEGVVLDKSSVNLSIPNNTTETVEVTAGKPVTWSSSNPNIATVESDADGNGVITAVAVSEEPITITATSTTDPTKTASVNVTVTNDAPQSTELKLSAYEVNIQKGSTETVLVTEGGPVTWSSSDTNIATVESDADGNGVITAVAVSEEPITITATSTTDSTKTASVIVNVIDSGNPSEKEVPIPNKTNISMIKGDLAQVSITNNIEVDWKSNDESVVTVDENGNIYAVDVGETTIDAISKVDSSKKASIKISVTDKNSGAGNQNAGNQNAGNQNGGNQDTGNQVAGNQAGGNSTGGIVTGGSTTNGTKTQSGNSSSAINEAVPATGESSVETVALLVIITLIVASIVFRSKSKIK